MRCPKCGYISFDQINHCLRCGKNIETTAAEVNGGAYNVPAPDYLLFDVHERREQDDADSSEKTVFSEEVQEAAEDVDFDFGNEGSEAPVEVNLDSAEEVDNEIDMDLTSFEEKGAVLEAAPPALENDSEEEGIAFSFDASPAEPVAPVTPAEDIAAEVEEMPDEPDKIEFSDVGLDDLFAPEGPALAPAHHRSKISMDDFDMDLDLGDLDLGLDDQKK